ncbi:MAG: hypothetical protein U0R26_12230 [Solirubrobacterales bacterium]
MERWEQDEVKGQFASIERDRLRLEERRERTERRLEELERRERTRIHLTTAIAFWLTMAVLVGFEIVMITLKVSAS